MGSSGAAGCGSAGCRSTAASSSPELRTADLRAVILPRSVALVGVSERTTSEIVDNVLGKGIPADGVHPRHARVHGLPCVPRIGDLAEPPECAFLLVGHRRVEAAFEEAVSAGVRAFVIPGLGSESGAEGPAVAARLGARARSLGVPVVGFNGMGVAIPDAASLWIGSVPRTFLPGQVSVVVHSGSIGEALLAAGPRIGFRAVVSSGSEAVRDVADFCGWFAGDDATRAVGLFLETIRRPAAFARGLDRLAAAGKPVVCCRVGRTESAARAVMAHSGALVSQSQAFSALLEAYGVIEVDDYPQFLEVLEVLGRRRRPRGPRIAGVSNSGGEAALLADQAELAGIPFEPLPAEVVQALKAAFPNFTAPQNPIDAWAVDEAARVFPGTFEILARSGRYDILISQVDQSQFLGAPEAENALLITTALANAVEGTPIFPAATSVQPGDPTPAVADFVRAHDIALLRGSGAGMRALAAVARWQARRPPEPAEHGRVALDGLLHPGALPEYESAAILERYGIASAPRRRARTPEEAAEAASAIGFPVVVKLDGPAHKSRVGGVILNLRDPLAVAEAAARLQGPVLVARQIPAGLEAYLGFHRDPAFGPILVVGPGGQMVEQLRLSASCLAPIDLAQARRLCERAPVIASASALARDALARALHALGWLAVDHPRVEAVDVNPLILHDEGAVAVDALVIVGEGGKA
ncbi:MAG TPA: acetate--CoA ligase family protein [Candidatus Limnocylindrales bacterium]|nr:acetate--CoA ligase family protein [Candidatus Limnocylindrales bacterium]